MIDNDDDGPVELGPNKPKKLYKWEKTQLNKIKEDFRRGRKGATDDPPAIAGYGKGSIKRKSFIKEYRLTPEEEAEAMALAKGSIEDKVEFIFELNRHFRFEPQLTTKVLASLWGQDVSTVRRYAQDAKRQYKYMAKHANIDPEVFRAEIDDSFAMLRDKAIHSKKAFMTKEGEIVYADQPDYKSAIMAQRARAELAGINGGGTPRRLKETKSYAELSDEEILEKAHKIVLELKGEDK